MASEFTCRTCGAKVAGFGAFMAHNRAHVAAGEAQPKPWKGSKPDGAPDAGDKAPARPSGKGRRRPARRPIVSTPAVERPLPDSPDAPPYFVQPIPPHVTALGEPIEDTTPEPGGRPTREQLRLELDSKLLAEILRNLSVVVSEWDGAGKAGELSHIEAGQLAMLLHEPTIEAVDRYFAGNVNRFRLALAAVVILLGKGRIHAKAIAAKRRTAQLDAPEDLTDALARQSAPAASIAVPSAEVAATNGHGPTVEPAPDPIAELAERQRLARINGQIGGEVE